ncbi:hypothetical protein XENOCAPTIV_012334, partial [Xenoophorus captivus]
EACRYLLKNYDWCLDPSFQDLNGCLCPTLPTLPASPSPDCIRPNETEIPHVAPGCILLDMYALLAGGISEDVRREARKLRGFPPFVHNPVIVPGKAEGGAGFSLSVPLPDILQLSLIALQRKAEQMSHSSIVESETGTQKCYGFF